MVIRAAGTRRPARLFLQKPALRAGWQAYSENLAGGFKMVKPAGPAFRNTDPTTSHYPSEDISKSFYGRRRKRGSML